MSVSDLFVKNNFALKCDTLFADSITIVDGPAATIHALDSQALKVTSSPVSSPIVNQDISISVKRIGTASGTNVANVYVPAFTIDSALVTVNTTYLAIDLTSLSNFLPQATKPVAQFCTVKVWDGAAYIYAIGTMIAVKSGSNYYLRIYPGYPQVAADGTITADTTNYANGFTSGKDCGLAANILFNYIQQYV